MKKLLIVFLIITSLSIQTSYALEALPQSFTKHVNSKFLSNPSVILVDQANMQIVYQNSEDRPRTPASVLKIFSTAAIALTLDSKTTFQTSLYKTDKKGVFVLGVIMTRG